MHTAKNRETKRIDSSSAGLTRRLLLINHAIYMANFLGTPGADIIFTGIGNDNANAGAGDDSIIASTGSDKYQGGSGYDTVFYNQLTQPITLKAFGSVSKQGGLFSDSLVGIEKVVATTSLTDTIDASAAGSPALGINIDLALGRVDVLGLGLGFDISGFEYVIGSALPDVIRGDIADNNIQAGNGNDSVFASGGNDTINGGAGNDILEGGAGQDTITGGSGNDLIRLTNRASRDVITDFSPSAAGNNDTFALVDTLDSGFGGQIQGGILGLAFVGGNVNGAVLSSSSFFKGAGLSGIGLGFASGIFVNTSNGEVRYNGGPTPGNNLLAIVSRPSAASLTVADFVYSSTI